MSFWSFMAFAVLLSTIASLTRNAMGWQRPGRLAWKRLGMDNSEEIARLDGAIAERDQQIEELQHRLSEMESRLDFAERLLTERSSTPSEH